MTQWVGLGAESTADSTSSGRERTRQRYREAHGPYGQFRRLQQVDNFTAQREDDSSETEEENHANGDLASRHSSRMDGVSNDGYSTVMQHQRFVAQTHFMGKQHFTSGNPSLTVSPVSWRTGHPVKTVHGNLYSCLNVIVDPPDLVKTDPCAVYEAWIDPKTLPSKKASEIISNALFKQFGSLSIHMKYREYPDPCLEDFEKSIISLRRLSKFDRALFYYNGHGVPKPTPSGELWVFNRDFSQYIPVSIGMIMGWLGTPAVYIWDCSTAGHIVTSYVGIAEKKDQEAASRTRQPPSRDGPPKATYMDCMHLAACSADEQLPMCPELPADLFTACLTTPIDVALRYFLLTSQHPPSVNVGLLRFIPGDVKERRTMLGEINWVLTSILDTIAWITFPTHLFQRLYRSDLLVAALFRNFLLADRVLRAYGCTPITFPRLVGLNGTEANTHTSRMWQRWDECADLCFRTLMRSLIGTKVGRSALGLDKPEEGHEPNPDATDDGSSAGDGSSSSDGPTYSALIAAEEPGRPVCLSTRVTNPPPTFVAAAGLHDFPFEPTEFFSGHLKAFSVWVATQSRGKVSGWEKKYRRWGASSSADGLSSPEDSVVLSRTSVSPSTGKAIHFPPPVELPILLQVLLSSTYRIQALYLLSQYMDLSPTAVQTCLIIGIFPYIQRLLVAPNLDLRAPLIYIWSRVIGVDNTTRQELWTTGRWEYFGLVLSSGTNDDAIPRTYHPISSSLPNLPNATEHRAMCLFILAEVARIGPNAQLALCFPNSAAALGSGNFGATSHRTPRSVMQSAYEMLLFAVSSQGEDDSELDSPTMPLSIRSSTHLGLWAILCLAQLWTGHDDIKHQAIEMEMHNRFLALLHESGSVEIRAACLFALACLVGGRGSASDAKKRDFVGGGTGFHVAAAGEITALRLEIGIITGAAITAKADMSPVVRKELVNLLSVGVAEFRGWFVVAAWAYWEEEGAQDGEPSESVDEALADWLSRLRMDSDEENGAGEDSVMEDHKLVWASALTVFTILVDLVVDPHPEVANAAKTVVDWIMAVLGESPFRKLRTRGPPAGASTAGGSDTEVESHTPTRTPLRRTNTSGTVTSTASSSSATSRALKRTSSLANAFVQYAFPSVEDGLSAQASHGGGSPSSTSPRSRAGSGGASQLQMSVSMASIASNTQLAASNATLIVGDNAYGSSPPTPALNLTQYEPPYAYGSLSSSPSNSTILHPPSPNPSTLSFNFSQTSQDDQGGHHENEVSFDFSAADCIESLVEEDHERIRARRNRAAATVGDRGANGHAEGSDYDLYRADTGIGHGIRNLLPLQSRFYEYAREAFIEPQMREFEGEQSGSVEYNIQEWRRQRNDNLLRQTREQAAVASERQWDRRVCSLDATTGSALTTNFHPFDTYLLVGNETSKISVWDWSRRKKVQGFLNGNPIGTSITSLRWINEYTGGLIMAGSSDGIVRLYRNHDPAYFEDPPQLVTAFQALPSIVDLKRGSGLVSSWSQYEGTLLVAGDSRFVVPWNARRELADRIVETGADSNITSVAFAPDQNYVFVAAFGDGSVRAYDRRRERACVQQWHDSTNWIQRALWRPRETKEIVTASVDGQLKLYDLRSPVVKDNWHHTPHPNGLSGFDMHQRTGVFATSSAINAREWRTQTTIIQSFNPSTTLARFNNPTALPHAPSSNKPVSPWMANSSSLSFHPNEMLLAVGGIDGSVKVYGCNLQK